MKQSPILVFAAIFTLMAWGSGNDSAWAAQGPPRIGLRLTKTDRDNYQKYALNHLSEIRAEIENIENRERGGSPDVRRTLHSYAVKLNQQYQEAKNQVEELKGAADSAWRQTRKQVEKTFRDIDDTLDDYREDMDVFLYGTSKKKPEEGRDAVLQDIRQRLRRIEKSMTQRETEQRRNREFQGRIERQLKDVTERLEDIEKNTTEQKTEE